jgi:hypothetical protein
MAILRRPATQCPHKRQCISKECRDCKDGLGVNECFVPKPKKVKVPKKPTVPLTPIEYHQLPDSKKPHVLALIYMARCCAEGFSIGGLFQLRNYFANKVDRGDLQILYDFIYAMPENTVIDMYSIYDKARAHQLNLRMASNTPKEVIEKYPSLLSFLGDL